MKAISMLLAAAMAVAVAGVTPAVADPGKGKGQKHAQKHKHKHAHKHRGHARYGSHCPPGLAKKYPACVPPGQARKHVVRYGTDIGDILRIANYARIVDYDRYGLERRDNWNYYRNNNQIYRVDSGTRKVLAVLNLIDAFTR